MSKRPQLRKCSGQDNPRVKLIHEVNTWAHFLFQQQHWACLKALFGWFVHTCSLVKDHFKVGGYRKVFPCLPLNHTASRAGREGKEATYTRNISEKLPGVSQASSGQDGGAGGQSSSHYVWIFESHIN